MGGGQTEEVQQRNNFGLRSEALPMLGTQGTQSSHLRHQEHINLHTVEKSLFSVTSSIAPESCPRFSVLRAIISYASRQRVLVPPPPLSRTESCSRLIKLALEPMLQAGQRLDASLQNTRSCKVNPRSIEAFTILSHRRMVVILGWSLVTRAVCSRAHKSDLLHGNHLKPCASCEDFS